MPLFEKTRIEVYVPDLPSPAYQDLLDALEREFTYTFGGCTILDGLHGSYLSDSGVPLSDRINLIYTDAPIRFDPNVGQLARFAEKLKRATFEALDEEAILVAAFKVVHSG